MHGAVALAQRAHATRPIARVAVDRICSLRCGVLVPPRPPRAPPPCAPRPSPRAAAGSLHSSLTVCGRRPAAFPVPAFEFPFLVLLTMEHNSEAANRALDAQCANERSMPSRTAVIKLKSMTNEDKTRCLAGYAQLDLGNLVRCALAARISADTRWGERNEPVLSLAAQNGSNRALKALLAGGACHALADKNGGTAAHYAAYFGHAACLRLLLDAGAQLEAKAEGSTTPLHLAAGKGHVEACKLLLLSGASAAAQDAAQQTALHWAAQKGQIIIIDRLLTAGAVLESRNEAQRTPLCLAAFFGQLEAVKALLARGADVNAADDFASTPLITSILAKHTPCVQTFLPVSDLSVTNRNGRNAFYTCIATGNEECFQLLLPRVNDVDVRTVPGVTSEDGVPLP